MLYFNNMHAHAAYWEKVRNVHNMCMCSICVANI